MKKLKRIFTLILTTVMTTMLLASCGLGKTKATPEESAKYFLDMVLKGDKSNIDKIGFKEEDYTELKTNLEDSLIEGFESAGVSSDILTDEIKNTLKNNMVVGFSKVEYEVGASSIDKKVATVEVKIKGFDMNKIADQAKTKTEDNYNESMTEQQFYQENYKFVGEGFANGVLVEQPKTLTIKLNKVKQYWIPDESSSKLLMESLVVVP
ncbi:DUF5105 domain-containing protein [Clostridium cellulovorans]|uniref:DUF5105 domain-containing protein n=1 Tax=Clostridium cellulovorans (strain ATCC 35296 / DSM 3052 / OCM 3 / 743B) TaxID=573061 RepID=D9SNS6_CLOC7|nr:DUF5105 domain-containing protein [Clostridium cellulovorans]ADL49947.1 hypothetical protein Clocel_0159 [Clostridium cellulovorans 743B]